MSDRELLELAAKAAGYVLVWGDKYKLGDDEIDCTDIPYIRSGQPDEGDIFWNPLTDSGQALELAVILPMRAVIDEVWVTERTSIAEWERDPLAATRLAITRAAAEIGKEMP